MIIELARPAPHVKQLIQLLKSEFGNKYSYSLFGVGKHSILVGKSFLHGAQISTRDNQISIQYSAPTVLGGFIHTIAMTELAVLLIPFIFFGGMPTQSSINDFLKEIAGVIKGKLNRED